MASHQVRASAEAREAALRSEIAGLRARDASVEVEVERGRRELYMEMEATRLAYDLSPMPRLREVNAQTAVALAAEQELKTALWATLLAVSAAVDPVLEATTRLPERLPEPDGMLNMAPYWAPALPPPSSLADSALGTAPTAAPNMAPIALPSGTKTVLQSRGQPPPPPPPPWTDTGFGSAARAATAAVAAAEVAIASASALARLSSVERGGTGSAGGAGGTFGAGGAGAQQQQAAQVEQWAYAQQAAHAQQAAATAQQAAHAQRILASVGRVCTVCTSALDRLHTSLANEAAVREEAGRHRGKLEEMRRELGARARRIPPLRITDDLLIASFIRCTSRSSDDRRIPADDH